MATPALRALLVFGAVAVAVYARGRYAADLVGGVYPLRGFARDLSLVCALLGLGWLLGLALHRITRLARPGRRPSAPTACLIASLSITAPLLVTALLLAPPRVTLDRTPANDGWDFESFRFGNQDRLHGWLIPPPDDLAALVVIAPGFGTPKACFLPVATMLRRQGFGVMLFDFRAHGESHGVLSTLGVHEADDVGAAARWLAQRFPGREIHALGYSMGATAIVGACAAGAPIRRVCLDGAFADLQATVTHELRSRTGPFARPLWRCAAWSMRLLTGVDPDAHRPVDLIARMVSADLLIVHGEDDRVVAPAAAEELFRAAPGSRLWRVAGARHYGAIADPRYPEMIARFFGDGS